MRILRGIFRKSNSMPQVDRSVLRWKEQKFDSDHWFVKKAKNNLKNKKKGEHFAKGKNWHHKAIKKNGKIKYYWRLRKGKAKKWKKGNQIIYTPKDFRNPFEPDA